MQWSHGIDEIHGIDHLQTIPQLAFERRVQEVAAVEDVHVPTLCPRLAYQGHDATEAAGRAILDGTDTVDIVEMKERQSRRLFNRIGRAGNQDKRRENN